MPDAVKCNCRHPECTTCNPPDPDPTAAELARVRLELEGEKKANALLYAGMGSQAELMDGLKQEARTLRAALADRDRQLAELRERPLYERVCACGDFESQHQGGGPCAVCCQSDRPGDGCEAFRFSGQYEKLTDVQKGILPPADPTPKEADRAAKE